jgi:hypothetical protein
MIIPPVKVDMSPFGFVAIKVLGPAAALDDAVMVNSSWVELKKVKPLIVTSPGPDAEMIVDAEKLPPIMKTCVAVPLVSATGCE